MIYQFTFTMACINLLQDINWDLTMNVSWLGDVAIWLGMEKDAEHGKIPEDSIFYTFYDFIHFMILYILWLGMEEDAEQPALLPTLSFFVLF